MQSNCIREASRACLKSCCLNPLPQLHHSSSSKPTFDPRRDFVISILSTIQPNTNFTNHESLPSIIDLFTSLRTVFPHYTDTVLADHIRAQEYNHLSISNHVCLDYTGHGLFSFSQKKDSFITDETASSSSFSPTDALFFDVSYKSVNLNSCLMHGSQESEFESVMRRRIMKHMNLFEEEYSLVFTANQASAFKILAEVYPFQTNQSILSVYDYENDAVEAMIDGGKNRGARAVSAVFSWPNLRVHWKKLRKVIVNKNKPKNRGLFVFPLQSRMTGSRYSYQWMNLARENGWHVLLDACALGPKDMETLGLSLFQPDFLICSFFKIFGLNPSGFCCLLVKKSIVSDLSQSSSSVGIISLIPVKSPSQELTVDEKNQENDINPYYSSSSSSGIVELDEKPESSRIREQKHDQMMGSSKIECRGLDHADTLGLILISTRIRCLVNWLVNALMSLRHPHSEDGVPLVRIYGPKVKLDRGPAIAFNVYDWKGERVDPVLVQKLADRNKISVSCGFLRNVWFSENFQEEKERMVLENRRSSNVQELKAEEKRKKKGGKEEIGIEVASVSVGMLTNFEDVYRVWAFVSKFLDADFVEKERWRYTALNQTTVEV